MFLPEQWALQVIFQSSTLYLDGISAKHPALIEIIQMDRPAFTEYGLPDVKRQLMGYFPSVP